MPIYEYECRSCNRVFEIWQKLSEQPKNECPQCSGSLTKLVSLSSFQLKGGGWYADGYSHQSEAKESKAEGGAKAEGAKAEESKGKESKGKEPKSSTGSENKTSEKTSGKTSEAKPKKSET